MRIVLVISSLSCGGAEKNISLLANYWCKKRHNITIVILDSSINSPFYYLNPKISLKYLNAYQNANNLLAGLLNNINRIIKLRSAIVNEKADYVISFMDRTNILVTLSLIGKSIPSIISERNDPKYNYPGPIWSLLRKVVYPMAKHIVLQSDGFRKHFPKRLQKKIVTIPNSLEETIKDPQLEGDKGNIEKPTLIAMGKLKKQKGFDVLIAAFYLISKKLPGWSLIIFGEGEEHDFLRKLIIHYRLENYVCLMGITKTPIFYMKQADIFVLSSRYEGFPNVLCEAMACGKPVVTTNCSPAISEIVTHKYNGIVVEQDVNELSNGIYDLITHPEIQKFIGNNAMKIIDRYNIKKISEKWENLWE